MPIRAVLFDATGTLIEVREPVGESYARFAAAHGVDLPARRLDDAFRRIVRSRELRLFPDAIPNEVHTLERSWWHAVVAATFRATDQSSVFDDFEAFFEDLFRSYATAEAWRLRPGAEPCLAALSERGLRMGVVSNFDYRLTEVLESLGIAGFFEDVILAGHHGLAKPDPRLFEAALRRLGAPAAETVFIGDDPERDLEGARRAGITPVDATAFASLAELPDHLATLRDDDGRPA